MLSGNDTGTSYLPVEIGPMGGVALSMGLLKRDVEPLKISLMSSDFPRLWEHPCEVNPPVDNNCQRRKLFQEEKREGIRIYSLQREEKRGEKI
jgi:hypothetical protein